MSRQAWTHPSELLPWFVNGTLEGEELRQVEEHLSSCLACRREVEELRELRREVIDAAPRPPGGGLERLLEAMEARRPWYRRGWFRPWQPLVATAALLVFVVGVSVWMQEHRRAPVAGRADDLTEVVYSLVDPEATLPRRAFVLRWKVEPEWREAHFSVTVTAEDLTPVAEIHGVEGMECQIPEDALAALPPGAKLFWRVEAVRPDGTVRTKVFQARLE